MDGDLKVLSVTFKKGQWGFFTTGGVNRSSQSNSTHSLHRFLRNQGFYCQFSLAK